MKEKRTVNRVTSVFATLPLRNRLLKMKPTWTLLLFGLSGVCCAQQGAGRRDDVINDWIRRIREAPKGHSMSPSWWDHLKDIPTS